MSDIPLSKPDTPKVVYLLITTGNQEAGMWCDSCNLPSAIRYPVNVLDDDGVTGGGGLTICPDCAERNDQ